MRGSSGILLIAIGLIVLFIGVTDRFTCFAMFFSCMLSPSPGDPSIGLGGYTGGTTGNQTIYDGNIPGLSDKPFGLGGIGGGKPGFGTPPIFGDKPGGGFKW